MGVSLFTGGGGGGEDNEAVCGWLREGGGNAKEEFNAENQGKVGKVGTNLGEDLVR